MELLRQGKPARALGITDPNQLLGLESLGLITAKQVLYVANVDEADPHGRSDAARRVREHAALEGSGLVAVSGKLEAELAELPPDDRRAMLTSLDLREPALATLAREAYRLLGLQSYFTAGPKEIRAWTIHSGSTAPQAAGVIHTDFERGFIRAEVYSVDDLLELGSEAAIRAAGRMRVEGRSYVFQDGDVAHFLFNV
jgi:ribosome-binding ATPase YchF (GTP1/OBG family)